MWGCHETISLVLSLQTFDFWTEANRKLNASCPAALSSWFKACLEQVTAKQARTNRHFLSKKANTDSTSKLNCYCWYIMKLIFRSQCIQPPYWTHSLVFQLYQLILLVFLGRLYALQRAHAKSTSSDSPPFKYLQAYLHFVAFCRYCVFYKLKIWSNPVPRKVYWYHFSNILIILWLCVTKLQSFSWLLYLSWWPVISDVTILSVLGHHEPCPHRQQTYLINVVSVLTAPPTSHSPISVSLGLPIR